MDCKHIEELLMEYLYQELDPAQAEHVETHLKACSRCAQDLASYEKTRAVVRDLPELEAPKGVEAILLREAARAAQRDTVGFWQRFRGTLGVLVMHPAMTAAVTLVVVLGVSFYVYRQGAPRRASEPEMPQFETDRRAPAGAVALPPRPMEEQAGAPAAPSAASVVTDKDKNKKEDEGQGRETRSLRFKTVAQREANSERRLAPAVARQNGDSLKEAPLESLRAGGQEAREPAAERVRGKGGGARDEEEAGKAQFAKKSALHDSATLGSRTASGASSIGKLDEGRSGELKEARGDAVASAARRSAAQPRPAPRLRKARAQAPGNWSQAADVPSDDAKRNQTLAKAPARAPEQQRRKSKTVSAAEWMALGDKASAAGQCSLALSYYDRALEAEPKLLAQVAPKVRPCATLLARDGDAPLLQAQKSYRNLSGVLSGELHAVRRVRASRARAAEKEVDVKQGKRAAPAAAKPTTSY